MRSIKFIALIVSILALLASCTTKGNIKPVKKMRAMWVVDRGHGYVPMDSNVIIMDVDTLYQAGDIITTGTTMDSPKFRLFN